jgi:hypothetical protein
MPIHIYEPWIINNKRSFKKIIFIRVIILSKYYPLQINNILNTRSSLREPPKPFSVPWSRFVAAILTSSPSTSLNIVEISESFYFCFTKIQSLFAAQLFYQALSRQVIKIHIKIKCSNWHYVNAAGHGLLWDCGKVQRWVTNIYFGDQGSRSEVGHEVLVHRHKWQNCFVIQVINPVRICTSDHEYMIKLHSRMGPPSLYVR